MEALNPYQIASIAVVCIIVAVLVLIGNPNYTRVVLQNEFAGLETDRVIHETNIRLYDEGGDILVLTPWEMKLLYKGEERHVFGYESSESLFNASDSKNVRVDGNEMTVTYFNESKDPKAVSIVLRLEGDILSYRINANVSNPEELEGIIYGYRFRGMGYEGIITPANEVILNEGDESYMYTRLQIPEVTKDFQLMVSKDATLNVSGEFSRILNSLRWQVSHFYTGVGEGIRIRVQKAQGMGDLRDGLYLTAGERISEDIVRLYEDGDEILYFRPHEMKLNYRGEERAVFGYDSPDAYFNGGDSKSVRVSGNEMVITYSNKSKDPKAVDIVFRLEGGGLKYDIVPEVSWPVHLDGIYYGYNFGGLGCQEIITPNENVIDARGNESYTDVLIGSKTWNDYQVMVSDERIVNVGGEFTKVWNSPRWQVSHLYSEEKGEVYISVQNSDGEDVPEYDG